MNEILNKIDKDIRAEVIKSASDNLSASVIDLYKNGHFVEEGDSVGMHIEVGVLKQSIVFLGLANNLPMLVSVRHGYEDDMVYYNIDTSNVEESIKSASIEITAMVIDEDLKTFQEKARNE
jgi:hypothetical protein